MKNLLRMLAAVVVGAICAVPPMMVGAVLRGWPPSLQDIPIFLALYGPFAFLALTIIGIPLHLLLNRRGHRHPMLYSVIGVLVACVVGAVLSILGETVLPGDFLALALSGMVAGLLFNVVAYCSRGQLGAPKQV